MATINFSTMLIVVISAIFFHTSKALTLPKFPAILIFGDSTMDTGNNNYIKTWLKANYSPYGEDFPGQIPTGRFSNGKLIPDIASSLLGIKEFVPPFLEPNLPDSEIITGVNFASAGAGFDDLTSLTTNAIPVLKQIDLFKSYIARLKGIVGEKKANEIINGALVVLSAGTNDWIFNMYNLRTRKLQFNVNQYQEFLMAKIQKFLQGLYDLGCRNFIVAGIPPIGCTPMERNPLKIFNDHNCAANENSDSQTYNEKLKKLLLQTISSLPGSKILYAEIYEPIFDMVANPHKYGFVEIRKPCCGFLPFQIKYSHNHKFSSECTNSSQYLFWDGVHPTQAGYQYIASTLVNDLPPKFLNNSIL